MKTIRISILSPADAAKIGVHIDGARVSLTKLSLNDCLVAAYKVKLHQISGPEWMASERFDINAKLPAGSNGGQIPQMMQALLTDRFGMKFHRQMKDWRAHSTQASSARLRAITTSGTATPFR